MKKRIRIGVLGCANIAFKSVIPAIKELDSFELIAVASRTSEKANHFAEHFYCEALYSYEALIDRKDIDALYIPLPTGLHEEWVMKALHANKHVFVEKSFALNFESGLKMLQLAEEKKLLILENFMFEFHAQQQTLKDLISKNEIGDVALFRSTFCFPGFESTSFRYDKDLGGGSLIEVGCYTLKASQFFFGNELNVEAVHFTFDQSGIDLSGAIQLKTDSGIDIQLYFGFNKHYYQCNYEFIGTKGKITANRAYTPPKDFSPKLILDNENGLLEINIPAENHFVNILNYFADTLLSDDFSKAYQAIYKQIQLMNQVKIKSITTLK